jgi:hypothetical protein
MLTHVLLLALAASLNSDPGPAAGNNVPLLTAVPVVSVQRATLKKK